MSEDEAPAEGILGIKTFEMTYGDRDYKAEGGKISYKKLEEVREKSDGVL